MKLQKTAMACSILTIIGSTSVIAEEAVETHQLSANVAIATDYIWRGISQTGNDPAIQGGFDYAHSSGLYAGTWASNVDFGAGDNSHIEVDIYGGFANEFNGIRYDVGIIHYDYPSESRNNFEEIYFGMGYSIFSAKISHTSDNFAESDDATYYEAGADIALPKNLNLSLHAAHYDLDAGSKDYNDWKVALSTELKGFGFELAYTDTDLSDNECGSNICDSRGIFTVSKSF